MAFAVDEPGSPNLSAKSPAYETIPFP